MSSRLPRAARRAAVALLGAALLWPAVAGAQAAAGGTRPMGMTDAVRAAVAWHPAVRNGAQQVLQAGAAIDTANAGYYPQVRAGINSQFSNQDIPSYPSRNVHSATLSVSQMLYDFGKVSSAVSRAQAQAQAASAQVMLSADDVARDTAQAWVEVHHQQALGVIARQQLDGVQALTDLVMEREHKGASSRSDTKQAQSRVEAARSQLIDAEAQVARGRTSLTLLTGGAAPTEIVGDPPAWLGAACAGPADDVAPEPPAVRQAEAQRAMAQADVRAADALRLPTLSVEGTVGRGSSTQAQMAGESAMVTTVGLNLSAPLYEGGAGSARQRAAAYALGAADASLEQARLMARQGYADASAQWVGDARRAPVLAAREQSIRETRDLYRQQYLQLGTRSLLDLLNAEQEYHSVRFEEADNQHERYRLAVLCLYFTDRMRNAFGIETAQADTP